MFAFSGRSVTKKKPPAGRNLRSGRRNGSLWVQQFTELKPVVVDNHHAAPYQWGRMELASSLSVHLVECFGSGVNLQFFINVADMGAHRFSAQEEPVCNILVTVSV